MEISSRDRLIPEFFGIVGKSLLQLLLDWGRNLIDFPLDVFFFSLILFGLSGLLAFLIGIVLLIQTLFLLGVYGDPLLRRAGIPSILAHSLRVGLDATDLGVRLLILGIFRLGNALSLALGELDF